MPRVILLPLLGLLLLVSGCGSDQTAADAPRPAKHAREHHRATPKQTATPAPAPAASPSRHARPNRNRGKVAPLLPLDRVALNAHLLTADRLPVRATGFAWRVVSSGPEDTARVGACQKTSLESIGAVSAVRRSYAATGGSTDAGGVTATQVVAGFADAKSAWRAHEVLSAWRTDCEERLDYPRKDVGPMETVDVRTGTGGHYVAAYGARSPDTGRVTGFGIVREGSYLSIVEVSTPTRDYPATWDPARAAVRRISRTFV